MASSRRIAIFGDSYVKRLGRHCNYDLKMPGELRFFAKGGMTAARPDVELLQELKTFQPHVVVVVLGGNDICTSSSPADIVSSLLRLQTQLHEAGTTRAFLQHL
ncbi:uncharacterized protein LOC127839377 [Dreissena polymorpha]|nr:uncharacterized protein LOC127839377 [Dreissena polymorpha]